MRRWPGKVAAAVRVSCREVRCHPDHSIQTLPAPEPSSAWDALLAYAVDSASWLDGVVVTGAEPTEDPDLLSLLAVLAEAGLPVRLETDGLNPDVLAHALAEDLVESVSVQIKTTPERYASLTTMADAADRIAATVAVVIASGKEHEFHTTADPANVALADLAVVACGLRGGRLYAIEQVGPPADGLTAIFEARALRTAARQCSLHLPTIVRGVA